MVWEEYKQIEENKKPAPVAKFKSGSVVGVVWENKAQNGGSYYTFEVVRNHYDKENKKWETKKTFSEADLPDLFAVATQLILSYRVKKG